MNCEFENKEEVLVTSNICYSEKILVLEIVEMWERKKKSAATFFAGNMGFGKVEFWEECGLT